MLNGNIKQGGPALNLPLRQGDVKVRNSLAWGSWAAGALFSNTMRMLCECVWRVGDGVASDDKRMRCPDLSCGWRRSSPSGQPAAARSLETDAEGVGRVRVLDLSRVLCARFGGGHGLIVRGVM